MGVSWSGSGGDHSQPFSTYVNNYWIYISTPLVCRHVANRVNFTLNVIYIFYLLCLLTEPGHVFLSLILPNRNIPSRRMCIYERESLCIACEQLAMFITKNLCMAG